MNILLLAPHPFYQERGTPIAVDLLLEALSRRGDHVDVLTYHEGADVAHPNVTIHRIKAPPFVHRVPPGPSWKKIVCDLYLAAAALRLARRNRYDVVHAVEEAAFIALRLKRRCRLPYLYDMDSSMPRQIVEKFPLLRPLGAPMRWLESRAVRGAAAVVAMCDALADLARSEGARRAFILRDVSLLDPAPPGTPETLRQDLGIQGPCFMYVGNLERYQGIDLLLESFATVAIEVPTARLVIAGGNDADLARYREVVDNLGLTQSVHFLGPQPLQRLTGLLAEADILVSPRIKGNNTPMKIYSYMHAGKAILATDLPTHTQVLNASVALLAPPDPSPFADAMCRLATDPALRAQLGTHARERAQKRHSRESFTRAANELWSWVEQEVVSARPVL